ncbi:fructose bisphosphate aldolase [Sulfitobacter sp. KE34]|jgi:fructose-bisphosphate aldolase class I|uniref:fructose-bisphosphate aldolase n=1 Tax=Sulfitobacter faviae TaxID=1775881 RepID=A0AAX3LJZ2_9RHOB|nr:MULTISPECIES: fructose bisphosphate aldolase [Sulfitobacter]MDF3350809.1 fructose bisphosphate aldolase [Sulfitobacter sp. KE12]MDF3353988.1 fructose bisphosphate aldolase [Sulfitobacter sp. KE27]MDF3358129.1 fructose bisphosphate aldolase [Sulfitobacter sp. KE33]MDF3359717.1 fructose bisphosphate aldolase [Sulfitobacter sp. Ks41]MDF3365060.1 fructose bisphosphate aldolase [Sulfitobacter sp. Ks34]
MGYDKAQLEQMDSGKGFIAALDQSGGSTPKALSLYGVEPSDYNGDEEMFKAVHDMRARIILADDFTSEKVIGAILFERTMDDTINGKPVAQLLWEDRGVVPFLKIDKGLEETNNGVQMMKPIMEIDDLLARAVKHGIFGTKERSVIHEANENGIAAVVAQQFELAKQVCAAGLVPIIEPEVNINSESKAEAEEILHGEIEKHLKALPEGEMVMLKLTIPEKAGLYDDLAEHANVLRVVALSGGYSTAEACERLGKNRTMIASFSRALTERLNVKMTDAEFNTALGQNIEKIYQASIC